MTKQKWNVGEVYAYKIESDLGKENGLFGQYFLIQKVAEAQMSPRITAPIVYIKITKDGTLPADLDEYNRLEYVQTWTTKYEERFWPYDFSRLEEDIAEKSKLRYEVDEYGFLPQFRALLLLARGKQIPPDLVYVGNFPDAVRPSKEFIPHVNANYRMIGWKKNSEIFDMVIIKAYCGHNLRTLKIYQRKE